jgi:hypothetical protein
MNFGCMFFIACLVASRIFNELTEESKMTGISKFFTPQGIVLADGGKLAPSDDSLLTQKSGLKNIFSIFLATMVTACPSQEMGNSGHQGKITMRNEIIAYVKPFGSIEQVDVTHLVEKYIKAGDEIEIAKDILIKNGFSVGNDTYTGDRKDVDMKSIGASYKIKGGWWYRQDIAIYIDYMSESGKVDSVLAKVNFKAI